MPKKRKTRKQKILTDHKKQVVSEMTLPATSAPMQSTEKIKQESITTGTFTLPTITEHKPHTTKNQPIIVSISEYGYLPTDLLRTAVLSGAIIITELLIRFTFVH